MKKLQFTQRSDTPHWVGDGFPVRSIFSYNDLAKEMSPFLLLDYAGPAEFPATKHTRGVGAHPHRGFETVTIVYSGEVEHRDSSGGGGLIGPGDVQWMTAASGLIHEEMHGKDFAKKGGPFEMVQLWVNLPKKDKMSEPKYQSLLNATIPTGSIQAGAATVRVIAGHHEELQGPAKTFTPINLWDLRVQPSSKISLKVPAGHTAALFVLDGEILVDGKSLGDAEIAVFEREGDEIVFQTSSREAKVLFLGGEPINEPVAGYGPFVMNTHAEIAQAMQDYQSGKMGRL